MSLLFRILAEPRILAVLLVAGAVGLGWWHYTGLKSDLATAQADLANARAQMVAAVELAQGNAEQLRRAEQQHKAALDALEQAYEEMTRIADEARAEDQEILSAPPEANGPVPPVLRDFLLRRFE